MLKVKKIRGADPALPAPRKEPLAFASAQILRLQA